MGNSGLFHLIHSKYYSKRKTTETHFKVDTETAEIISVTMSEAFMNKPCLQYEADLNNFFNCFKQHRLKMGKHTEKVQAASGQTP